MESLNIHDATATSRPSLLSSLWSLQVQLQNEPISMDMAQCASQQSLPDVLMNNGMSANGAAILPSRNRIGEFGSNVMIPQCSHVNCAAVAATSAQHFRCAKSMSDLKSLALHCSAANTPPLINDQVSKTDSLRPMLINDDGVASTVDDAIDPPIEIMQHDYTADQLANAWPLRKLPLAEAGIADGIGLSGGISRQQRNNNICQWLQRMSLTGNDAAATSPSSSASIADPMETSSSMMMLVEK